jgi:predicted NBD/HSP70 family sugar kinase
MNNPPLIIGIDGGATKISAWRIERTSKGFVLGSNHSENKYSSYPSFNSEFTPVEIQTQLEEINSSIALTDSEQKQGQAFIHAFTDTISELSSDEEIIIGIGMPGIKTTDGRGIAAMANGPRIPKFCDELEKALSENSIKLAKPIHHLGSDADYCGLGEEYADTGLFKSIENAYYLGGGTGAADALKLEGNLIPLDETKSWLLKSWEMKNNDNIPLERYASAGGIQSIYSTYSGKSISSLNRDKIFPNIILDLADQGDEAATETFSDISFNLAELLFERIETIYSGWEGRFGFVNPNRETPSSQHPFIGTTLDRIIIGQRLGTLLELSEGLGIFWEPFVYHLTQLINESDHIDSIAKSAYLNKKQLNQNLIQISMLRDAPALGAGIDAVSDGL